MYIYICMIWSALSKSEHTESCWQMLSKSKTLRTKKLIIDTLVSVEESKKGSRWLSTKEEGHPN